jgi:proteasome lid subunit RPN8/RPN11
VTDSLHFRRSHYDQMLDHVMKCLPEEACGLVGGRASEIELVLPVTNMLHSAHRFQMEPREQLNGLLLLQERKLDLLAIYHSHPSGPAHPSDTDLREHAYPGALTLIWSRENGVWQVNCYSMQTEHYTFVRLVGEGLS